MTGQAGAVSAPQLRGIAAPVRAEWYSSALKWGVLLAAFGLAVLVRWQGRHVGLVYPDGYQYLLMAKGIKAHLIPTLQLGHGGELFVPSIDAALKPLFPALVALVATLFRVSLRAAADGLTVASAAATVILVAVLSTRLTGSRTAGMVAGGAALLSPAVGFWSGFTGPDPLAQVLVLATALALASDRARVAGVLGALCASSRPEWMLVLLSGAVAALIFRHTRHRAGQALVSGAFTLALLIGLVRPPLGAPFGGWDRLLAGLAAGVGLALLAAWLGEGRRRAVGAAVLGLCAVVAVAVTGQYPALASLLGDEWPLLGLAALGLVVACAGADRRPALLLLAVALLLGAVYRYRNPDSERYLVQLLPLACVAVAFVAVPRRWAGQGRFQAASRWLAPLVPVAAVGAIVLTTAVAADRPAPGPDTFSTLAGQLATAPRGTLVSAAPDAYGFLLPNRPQQSLRVGRRGLILLDAAQRMYAPNLTARGVVLARFSVPQGFERPDGTLDTGPSVLVRGVVVARPAGTAPRPLR